MMFLKSYNDDLAVLALKVMASLACPPMIHKCLEENRHETAIHKNTAMCNPFFEIGNVDSCVFIFTCVCFLITSTSRSSLVLSCEQLRAP